MTRLADAALGFESYFSSRSDRMQELFRELDALARDGYSVLLAGPSGTGKECMARYYASRAVAHGALAPGKSFEVRNCSCLAGEIALTELFGVEEDAFGLRGGPGAFELCGEGLLFLDEIGDLPAEAQPLLLRALGPDGQYRRIGGVEDKKVTARVIAATNKPLTKIRTDLRARLGHVIELPRLGDRRDDICPAIRWRAVRTLGGRGDRPAIPWLESESNLDELATEFVEQVRDHALSCEWVDNFRGLRNATEYALCVAEPTNRAGFLADAARRFKNRAGTSARTAPIRSPEPPRGAGVEASAPAEGLAQRIVVELRGIWGSCDEDRESIATFIVASEGRPFQASEAADAIETSINTAYKALNPLVDQGILEKPGRRKPYRLKAEPSVSTPAVTPLLRPRVGGIPGAELTDHQRTDATNACSLLENARRVFLAGGPKTGRTTVALEIARRIGVERPVLWWSFRQVDLPSEPSAFAEFLDALEEGLVMHGAPASVALGDEAPLLTDLLRSARLSGYLEPAFGPRPLLILDAVDNCFAAPEPLTFCIRHWTSMQLLMVGSRQPNLVGARESDRLIEIKEYPLSG